MKVIVCLEDNNGMTFNRRRVSSDAEVTRRILEMTAGETLWMNEYSAKLFVGADICVSANFLEQAGEREYCFVEDTNITPYAGRIEQVIIYRWNRRYPSDQKFMLSLDDWRLIQTQEFAGKSHSVITEEVYMR